MVQQMSRDLAEQKFAASEKSRASPPSFSYTRMGFLTEKQFVILTLRAKGYSQGEIAAELHMTRSSVSMIEGRARQQVERARHTLRLFELTQTQRTVAIEIVTRLQQIPLIVLQEADKHSIHLRKNMVDILRMVKKEKREALSPEGRTTKRILFSFNERGKLSLK